MKVEITARRLTVDAKTKDTIEKRLEKLVEGPPAGGRGEGRRSGSRRGASSSR